MNIKLISASSFGVIAALIEQLLADEELLSMLNSEGYGGSPRKPHPRDAEFNVKKWQAAWRTNKNLWRLRPFDVAASDYRLVYAYVPQDDQFWILGIAKKSENPTDSMEEFDYDLYSDFSRRVISDLQDLLDDW